MDEIQKPITVVRMEFITSLSDMINNSKLPPFILEPIFKDMYTDIRRMAQRQYELDLERYNKEINGFNESGDSDE